MPSISVNTFKVHKIEPRPDKYKRDYLSFMVKFNVEKRSLISFNLYNNKNQLLTSYKKRVYDKGEELILEGYQLETQQHNLNPTTLTVWLVDGNNQRVSDIGTSVLYITSFARTTPPEIGTGFERGQAYQAPREQPELVTGELPFVTKKPPSVFKPAITLSQNTKNIINGIESGSIIVPAWFIHNIDWVKSGHITETEFVNAYNFLTPQEPEVTIAPIPEITIPSIPEVSAVMELITTNFQVKLDNKIQFSSSLSNADYKRLKDEMSLEPKITLVFLNQTDFNPLSNFSNILRKIQNLLQGQVVETITISPTGQVITTLEPTVAPGKTGLMGAGVLGIIGILMLGGFIADHVRRKR